MKKKPGCGRSTFVKVFFPEAILLSVISLSFTVPFSTGETRLPIGDDAINVVRALDVGLFGAVFAMETMADTRLGLHRQEQTDLCRHGCLRLVAASEVSLITLNISSLSLDDMC